MGLSCWIAHKSVWSPQNPATTFKGRTLTYAELEQRIVYLAGYLVDELGVGSGDRVGYLGLNSDFIVELFFACARVRAIFVPLNSRLTTEQLTTMLENAAPKCLFAGQAMLEPAEVCGRARPDMSVIALRNGGESEGLNVDALPGNGKPIACDPDLDQRNEVFIAYTSGTTGTPKGAVYTQDALTFSAINSINCWNMSRRDHVLTYLPMFHVGGFLIHTLPAFHTGAQVTIVEEFDPGDVLRRINDDAVTLILAPPRFSQALFDHADWHSTDLSSLRCVGIGSTFVPPLIMQTWLDRKIPTQQNYGLTEGVPALGVPWENHRRKAHTAGLSMLYCQARVMDENLNRQPAGEPGEIMLRGRSLSSGYWRNPEATSEAFKDGWFRTGDIAFTDDEGYFHIVDRKKNIVIVGSSNVYPADLEKVLDEDERIAEAAVVGCPDTETGEALVACIRSADPDWADSDEVRKLFVGRLAEYQHPKHVLFVSDFPRTSLGKIQKIRLAERVRSSIKSTPC